MPFLGNLEKADAVFREPSGTPMPFFGPFWGGDLQPSDVEQFRHLDLLPPGEAVVGVGEAEVIRPGLHVPVDLRAGLLVLDQSLGIGGHVGRELLEERRSAGEHHQSLPDHPPGSVEGFRPVLPYDPVLLVPSVGSLLVLVEVIEPDPSGEPACEGLCGVDLRQGIDDAEVDVEPLHQVVELGEGPENVQVEHAALVGLRLIRRT